MVSNATTSPSFLALHPSGDGDGRLLADEILYDRRLDADLVVLSACRTALGPVEGDGVIGFARAFRRRAPAPSSPRSGTSPIA